MESDKEHMSDVVERMNIRDDASDSDEDVRTPMRPSAKALGKRRVIEDVYGTSKYLLAGRRH